MAEQVRITYVRSSIGRNYKHKKTIKALGFTKLNQSRLVNWNPSVAGMVGKVSYLLKIEPVISSDSTVADVDNDVKNDDDTTQAVSSETTQETTEAEKDNDA